MYSIYPEAIDGYAQLPLSVTTKTAIDAESLNRLRSAIVMIEMELGVLPSGEFKDVSERLGNTNDKIEEFEKRIKSLEENVDKILSILDPKGK